MELIKTKTNKTNEVVENKRESNKFFDNIKKYRLIYACAVLTFLFVLTGYSAWWNILLCGAFTAIICFLKVDESVYVMFFMSSFSQHIPKGFSYAYNLFPFVAILIIKYILDCKKGKVKLYTTPLVLSIVLTIVPLIASRSFFASYLNYLAYPIMFYIIFCYRKTINITKLAYFGVVSILTSVIISLAVCWLPHYQYLSIFQKKLQGFFDSPNYLCAKCALIIAYFMALNIKGKINNKLFLGIFATLFIIASFCISKAFIILISLVCFGYVFVLFVKDIRKTKVKFLSFACCMIILLAVLFVPLRNTLFRLAEVKESTDVLNTLTTSRWDIWRMYIKDWSKSFATVLFGGGLVAKPTSNRYPHSLYVFLLYRYGIIGIITLIALVVSYIKIAKPNRFRWEQLILIGGYFVWGVIENAYHVFNVLLIVLVFEMAVNTEIDEYDPFVGLKQIIANKKLLKANAIKTTEEDDKKEETKVIEDKKINK